MNPHNIRIPKAPRRRCSPHRTRSNAPKPPVTPTHNSTNGSDAKPRTPATCNGEYAVESCFIPASSRQSAPTAKSIIIPPRRLSRRGWGEAESVIRPTLCEASGFAIGVPAARSMKGNS